jgi:SpoIIAA-like
VIKVTADEAKRVLVIELIGVVSEADIDAAFDDLQNRYPGVGVRVVGSAQGSTAAFVDWEHLEGWEHGAKTLGTLTSKSLSDVIRRAAIVADQKWRDETPRLADALPHAEVRMFPLDQREQAWTWLCGD